MSERRVRVGVILGAHGVRGLVRIRTETADPQALRHYAPITDASGLREFRLAPKGRSRGALIALLDGINSCDAAQALRGTELYVARAALAALGGGAKDRPDEYYAADLIGLAAVDGAGRALGTVAACHDFGAGDILDLALADGRRELIPFSRAAVPAVDVAGGRIVVDPAAAGLTDDETPV